MHRMSHGTLPRSTLFGIALLLIAVSLAAVAAVNAVDDEDSSADPVKFKVDGINYQTALENEVSVIYGSYSGSLTIPASVTYSDKVYRVTSIAYGAFNGNTSLTSVSIPSSITYISPWAFEGCTSLTDIDVSEDNGSYISVSGVLFNDGMTELIRYPAGKTDSSFTIPDSVISVSTGALSGCTSLTSIAVSDGNSAYCSVGGVLFDKARSELIQYPAGRTNSSYTIPGGVINVSDYAFYGCTSLTSVRISENVAYIGSQAFYGCTSLVSVHNNSCLDIKKGSYDNGFVACYATAVTGDVDEFSIGYLKGSYNRNSKTATVTGYTGSPSSLNLNTVVVNGVTYDIVQIGYSAFSKCTSLVSVTLGSNVESILDEAFCECISLTSVTLGSNVGYIGESAFGGCTSLTSIAVPGSVTYIAKGSFMMCSSLTSIGVSEDNLDYCSVNGVLFDKDMKELVQYPAGKSDQSYTIPDGIISVGAAAFTGSQYLTSVAIPKSVTSLGYGAFAITALQTVAIPGSITYIGDYAFMGCTSLTQITIHKNVYYYGGDSFALGTSESEVECTVYGCTEGMLDSYADEHTTFSYIPLCTVTYDLNGGRGTVASASVYGEYTLESYDGRRSGCNFIGWTDGSEIFKPGDTLNIMSDTTFYAVWENYGENFTSDTVEGVTLTYMIVREPAGPLRGTVILVEVPDDASGSVALPGSVINGSLTYDIVGIDEGAFYRCESITSVVMPDSVITIDDKAFYSCKSLESVILSNSLTSMGEYVFYECVSLKSVIIPNSLTSMGERVFYGCVSLESVTLSNSLTSMGECVFYGCVSLKSVIIPNSLTSMGECAFYKCISLENVTLSNSMSAIEHSTFDGCESLKSITIPENVTTIGEYSFSYCISLASITIGRNVTTIGEGAFASCTSFKSIVIPDNVTSLGNNAFCFCASVETLTIGNGLTAINSDTFVGLESLKTVTIGSSVTTIGSAAFHGCKAIESITIPDNVTAIGIWAFSHCESLRTVTLSNNVTSISRYAFAYCDSLVSFSVNDNVTDIGDYAFAYCTSLASITIPDGVRTIGESAFFDCSSITFAYIGRDVCSIGKDAFAYCISLQNFTVSGDNKVYCSENGVLFNADKTNLIQYPLGNDRTSYTIPDTVTSVETLALSDCSNLIEILVSNNNTAFISYNGVLFDINMTELFTYPNGKADSVYNVPDGVEIIRAYAFYVNDSLETIDLNGVTTIGYNAFGRCSALTSVLMSSSVQSIGDSAFYDCDALISAVIPGSVQSIGNEAFYDCDSLVSVVIQNGVQSVGNSAFCDCDSLVSVEIPGSIQRMENHNFSECKSLTTVILCEGIQTIGYKSFEKCDSLKSIVIPSSVTTIRADAFLDCDSLESVVIPGNVQTIGTSAFSKCDSLKSITICAGAGTIGSCAFYGCSSLTSIIFHAEDCKIGSYAFNLGDKDNMVTCKVGGCAKGLLDKYGNEYTVFQYETLYTVIYDLNGASEENVSEEVFVGDYTLKGCTGTRIGYTFGGWSCSDITYQPGDSVAIDSDMTFTAIWNINQYTISFDSNGGSSVNPIAQDYGTYVSAPTEPLKTGYTFTKWMLGDETYEFTTMPAEDITLMAVWTVNQYTISFDSNGGSSVNPIAQDYGTDIYAPESPTRTGYTFVEWQLNGENYEFSTMPAEDITLNAVWEVLIYTIIFKNGDTTVSTAEYAYDSVITAPEAIPVKESDERYDYSFSHWNGYTQGMTVTGEQTFDAVFSEALRMYTVAFYSEDRIVDSMSLAYGDTIVLPEDPVKESTEQYEYTFKGWNGYTEGMTVSGDAEFEAVFEEVVRKYTVSFMNGTDVYRTYSIGYDSEITVPDVLPSKASTDKYDYSFVSWSGYTEGMKVSGAHSFDAVYEPVLNNIDVAKEKVTVDANDVDDVKISSDVIDQIRNAGAQGKDTTISMSNGSITLDGASASSLSAGAKSISLQTVKKESIPEKIRSQIGDRPVYSISIGDVHEFNGTLTISVKYDLKDGEKAEDVCIWYIKSDGSYDKIVCTYSNGYATFTTNHLSEYAVMIEESQPAPAESGSNLGLIIGGVIAAVAILAVAVFFVKRH